VRNLICSYVGGWDVGGFCVIGYSDNFFLFFGTFCSRRGVGLPPRFCYVCVCVGFVHLVVYGRENKCVKCRNG